MARSVAVHLKGMCEIKCVEEKTRANAVSLLGTARTMSRVNNFLSSPTTTISAK